METDPEVQELRRYLQGLTWGDFEKRHSIQVAGCEAHFLGCCGIYLGRTAMVIVAYGKFIAVQFLTTHHARLPLLDPTHLPESFLPSGLWLSDNTADKKVIGA